MKYKIIIVGLFILGFFILEIKADTVYLKDGRIMVGIVTKINDETVELNTGKEKTVFDREKVEKIKWSDINEFTSITKNLREQESVQPENKDSRKGEAIFQEQSINDLFRKDEVINIAINPMTELVFKTRDEIYEMRKQYVLQYPQLVDAEYEPSEDVFSEIEDGTPGGVF